MSDFKTAHKKTMGDEGGYANNPDDAGGETYKGIARHFWAGWPGWPTIDLVKKGFTSQPIYNTNSYYNWVRFLNKTLAANATLQQRVLDFYETNFWDANRIGEIVDQNVANWAYDHAVNGGSRGIKWIQQAAAVNADGQIGAKTIAAINAASPAELLERAKEIAVSARIDKVKSNPSQRQFLHSWLSRDGCSEAEIRQIMESLDA